MKYLIIPFLLGVTLNSCSKDESHSETARYGSYDQGASGNTISTKSTFNLSGANIQSGTVGFNANVDFISVNQIKFFVSYDMQGSTPDTAYLKPTGNGVFSGNAFTSSGSDQRFEVVIANNSIQRIFIGNLTEGYSLSYYSSEPIQNSTSAIKCPFGQDCSDAQQESVSAVKCPFEEDCSDTQQESVSAVKCPFEEDCNDTQQESVSAVKCPFEEDCSSYD